MSGDRPEWNRKGLSVLLLAATALVGGAKQAVAQDTELRGAVGENSIRAELLPSTIASPRSRPSDTTGSVTPRDEGIPAPRYDPVSTGPVRDEAATTASNGLFGGGTGEQATDASAPMPSRRPTTARQRAEEAARRSESGPETASDRLSASQRLEAQRRAALQGLDDETTTGTVPIGTVDAEIDDRVDPGAEAVEPIEGLDRTAEENPYAALGVRAGSFLLRPSVETGVTWTSNANSTPTPESAFLSETTLRLNAQSEWAQHSATVEAYGTFRKSISGAAVKETEAGIKGNLEIDLGHEFRALAALDYSIKPESASSPVVITGTAERPIRQNLTGSVGLEKDAGKFRFAATGKAERSWFGDADLSTGGTLSQRDRNATLTSFVLRGGYEISPALTPFVEAEVGRRFYDLRHDSAGFERSALRLGARAGVAVDLGEKLTGQLSAGWIREKADDSRLAAISGATVDASINWSPVRGTIVGLSGNTTVEGTTTPGEAGSLLYSGRLSVERQVRANLTASAALGAALRDYSGSNGRETTLSAEAGLTWWLNRYAGLTGRLRHERMRSNLPDRGYSTNSVFLGLKLQR